MATQQNIAISSPEIVAQNTAFIRAVEKNQRKGEKEIAHLATILKLVEEEIAEAKSGVGSNAVNKVQANESEGPSNTAFERAMSEMTLAFQMLQVLVAKYSNNRAKADSKISESQIEAAKQALKDIEKKIAEIKKKQEEAEHASFWEKLAEAVVGAALVIAGALLAQPELVVMGILSCATAAGAFDLAAKGVGDVLLACGMDRKVAEMVASILVTVLVVAISVAACNPEMAIEEGAEETATSTAQSAKNFANVIKNSKLGRAFSTLNKVLGPRGRLALMSLFQSLSHTQAAQKITEMLCCASGVSKKEREAVERDIGIGLEVASLVVTLLCCIGTFSEGEIVAKAGKITSVTRVNMARIIQKAGVILGTLGQSSAGTAQGAIKIQQGKLEKGLAGDRANLELLSILTQMIGTETDIDQKQQSARVKSQKVGLQSTSQLMNGIEGFANLAVYSSPV